jgi:hypothetical protein
MYKYNLHYWWKCDLTKLSSLVSGLQSNHHGIKFQRTFESILTQEFHTELHIPEKLLDTCSCRHKLTQKRIAHDSLNRIAYVFTSKWTNTQTGVFIIKHIVGQWRSMNYSSSEIMTFRNTGMAWYRRLFIYMYITWYRF